MKCCFLFCEIMFFIFLFFLILTQEYFVIDFREKGREEKNISVREKHQSVAFCVHTDRGLNPQPFFVVVVQGYTPTN